MKYQIVLANMLCIEEERIMANMGLTLSLVGSHSLSNRTKESFSFNEAQVMRDKIIKHGGAPEKLRVEYAS